MTDAEVRKLFRSLTPEEYARVKAPSSEEIREALRRASEDMRRCAAVHPCIKLTGRFY